MENEKINLNNISKRLNEMTDYLVDLKKETARVVIKQIYYNCFLNKLKLEDIFEILSEMREETNLRLQIELENFDELFEMMNDTLEKYIGTKEHIQRFAKILE